MAMIANCRPRGRSSKTYTRADFHPMHARAERGSDALAADISVLKMFLVPKS